MEFVATHQSTDLNELVMIHQGIVYRQTDDFMECEPCGYVWEYNTINLLPLKEL